MQTASAFDSVQTSLSFFINVYRTLAEWRAVIERLDGFEPGGRGGAGRRAYAAGRSRSQPGERRGRSSSTISRVRLPNGAPLVAADDIADRRAASACWSPGRPARASRRCSGRSRASGRSAPARVVGAARTRRLMMLPQRPYFPVGPLAAAVTYPAEPGTYRPRADRRGDRRRRAAGAGGAARRGGALEPDAVARRAAAARASPARCCRRRTSCSSTRPPRRSTSHRRPRSIACCRSGCRTRRSCRSATARRCRRSTAGGWRSSATASAFGVREAALKPAPSCELTTSAPARCRLGMAARHGRRAR